MDAMDASCQSCHSACDDGTDCQVEGCGDGTVPDGSGGCCFETVDDIDTDQAKKDLEEATAALEKASSKKEKLDATQAVKKSSARLQAAMFGKK